MLQSAIILGLSTCTFALNAWNVKRDSYSHGNVDSRSSSATSVGTTTSIESTPTLEGVFYPPVLSATSHLQRATRSPGYGHSVSEIPYPTGDRNQTSAKPSPTSTTGCASYWLENIEHQGIASFNNRTSYQVFRNVKTYGAKGDGRTDDTAAIQRAITDGNRCTPGFCESSTTTPALVYFPSGTYVISASIIDYYYTQVCHVMQLGDEALS
jgi:glucan 1,3-beta-glucosidase